MEQKELERFKSLGVFLSMISEKYIIVSLNVSEDKNIAIEVIGNGIERTKKMTGRIFKLVRRISDEEVAERQKIIENSELYNQNKVYFDPNTFEAWEYEPYMFVAPIMSY